MSAKCLFIRGTVCVGLTRDKPSLALTDGLQVTWPLFGQRLYREGGCSTSMLFLLIMVIRKAVIASKAVAIKALTSEGLAPPATS